ncbi:MAG TPA: hypothetical protein VGH38_32240 [Bryobacteraceae bacterium]
MTGPATIGYVRLLIQKLHTYAGLLTFVNFIVFGLVGLSATLQSKPAESRPVVRYENFTVDPNLTDRQVAERVATLLRLSLATPIQSAVIQHDAGRNLLLDFWHANGRHRVTVLEKDGRLRVETMRNSLWSYLGTLHATTAAFHSGDWRMQLWARYNEFAMWCLIGMIASGAALWLLSRPGYRLAQVSLAVGSSLFAAFYFLAR